MPSLKDVLRARQRSLIAKEQLQEFAGWGDATNRSFRQAIAEHVAIDQKYAAEVVERRRNVKGCSVPNQLPKFMP